MGHYNSANKSITRALLPPTSAMFPSMVRLSIIITIIIIVIIIIIMITDVSDVLADCEIAVNRLVGDGVSRVVIDEAFRFHIEVVQRRSRPPPGPRLQPSRSVKLPPCPPHTCVCANVHACKGASKGTCVQRGVRACVQRCIRLFVCACVCDKVRASSSRPSVRPSFRPSARLFVRPSVRPSARPPVHPPIRPSVRPPVHPFGCAWVCRDLGHRRRA